MFLRDLSKAKRIELVAVTGTYVRTELAGIGSESDRVSFTASDKIENHSSVALLPDEQDEQNYTNVPVDDLKHK